MADEFDAAGLSERFRAVWTRCLSATAGMDAAPVYKNLADCYAEPHRRYHSWNHLVHCLRELDRASALTRDRDAVEMALWFHDAVYMPGAADNERRSADLFVHWSERYLPPDFVGQVSGLILQTTHKQPPKTEADCYVMDIDLSSLGVAWNDFVRDSQDVRNEQTGVQDADYYPAQARFLESLLDRPRIFSTDHFRSLYEESARSNIKRWLGLMASEGKV